MKYELLLFFAFTTLWVYGQNPGQVRIDSLLGELSHAADDTNKVNLLDELTFAYERIDPAEGLKYGLMAVELAEKLEWKPGIAVGHAGAGINYKARSEYFKALSHELKAMELYRQLGNKRGEAAMLANISLIYSAQSDYPEALEYAFKALKMNEELGNKPRIAIITENIGTLYFEQKNHPKALQYYEDAASIYAELQDRRGLARNTGNQGLVHDAQGDFSKALEYHREALRTNEELGDKYSIQINLANLGIVHGHMQDYARSLKYHTRALAISEELGSKSSIAINMGNIGGVYYAIAQNTLSEVTPDSLVQRGRAANLKLAVHYLEQADSLCRAIGFFGPLIEYSRSLSEAYRVSGDYKKALEYYEQHTALKDSVFSIENQARIASIETKRELAIRDRDLLLKDNELRIKELEVARKQDELKLYSVSIVLLLLIIGMMLKSYIAYRKSNRALSSEKKKHLLLIEEQIGSIKAHTKVLEEIAYMQAHDIRGPVATILGLVELLNMDDFADPANREVIEGIATVTQKLDAAVREVIKKENSFRR